MASVEIRDVRKEFGATKVIKGAAASTTTSCNTQVGTQRWRHTPTAVNSSISTSAITMNRPTTTSVGVTKIGLMISAASTAMSSVAPTRRSVSASTKARRLPFGRGGVQRGEPESSWAGMGER